MQIFATFSSLFYLALIVIVGHQRYQREIVDKLASELQGSGLGK